MKLSQINDVKSEFGMPMCQLIFDTEEKVPIVKTIAVTNICVVPERKKSELAWRMGKAIMEAERDYAYRLFGDKWREHVGPGFDLARNTFVLKNMKIAEQLRPDLIGAVRGE